MNEKHLFALFASGRLEGASPEQITNEALTRFEPKSIFVGFSGGFDSLVATHWMMNNVPGCEVFHIDTGIGIPATEKYVKDTCEKYDWPLTVISAKNDCGQDYEEIVLQYGFPGPSFHNIMFFKLKERAVNKLLRDNKKEYFDHVMLATGIRKDESLRRSGYAYQILQFTGNLLWANPFYYRDKEWFYRYILEHNLEQNPISVLLGMSGECLCGAYAKKGELSAIKAVCSETYNRIVELEKKVKAAGFEWGWEDRPTKKQLSKEKNDDFMPFCAGCQKRGDDD